MSSNFSPRKSCHLWDNVKKCGGAREAKNDDKLWLMRVACWINKATRPRTCTCSRAGAPTHPHTHVQARTHRNMNYLLLFHCNNSFVNALQPYVYTYVVCVFCVQDVSNLNTILPFDGIFSKVILGETSGFRRGVVKAFAREEYCPSYAGRLGPLDPRRWNG